jgi:hypothetical protein
MVSSVIRGNQKIYEFTAKGCQRITSYAVCRLVRTVLKDTTSTRPAELQTLKLSTKTSNSLKTVVTTAFDPSLLKNHH